MSLPASSSPASLDSLDSKLLLLKDIDTVFLVDDSGSMTLDVLKSKRAPRDKSRWYFACQLTADFAELAARYDADGVDVHFLNQTMFSRQNLKTRAEISSLFTIARAHGLTPLGTRLRELMGPYLNQLEHCDGKWPKPRNYIVLTDGVPFVDNGTDEGIILENHLKYVCSRLIGLKCPKAQIGVQFVQVGNDKEATRFLQRLDDNDFGEHDFVDTIKPTKPRKSWQAKLGLADFQEKPFDQRSETIKALLGGMDRYYDNYVHA